MLVLLTGLPGTGKTTIASAIAGVLDACVLSADPIDAALTRAAVTNEEGRVGYEVMKALAHHQLEAGRSVVIDAVNPFRFVRAAYADIAGTHGVPVATIVTMCSDIELHRHRIADRRAKGMKDIGWEEVAAQIAYYESYDGEGLVLDAIRPLAENCAAATEYVIARSR